MSRARTSQVPFVHKRAVAAISQRLFDVLMEFCYLFSENPEKNLPSDSGRWWRIAQAITFDGLDDAWKSVFGDIIAEVKWQHPDGDFFVYDTAINRESLTAVMDDFPHELEVLASLDVSITASWLAWLAAENSVAVDEWQKYEKRGIVYKSKKAKHKIMNIGEELGVRAQVNTILCGGAPIEDVLSADLFVGAELAELKKRTALYRELALDIPNVRF